MQFDGAPITEGDRLYDVAYGHGVVERIVEGEDKIICDFNGRKYAYTTGGVGVFRRKTLFWQDPIGNLKPSKDKRKWDYFERLRDAVASVVL